MSEQPPPAGPAPWGPPPPGGPQYPPTDPTRLGHPTGPGGGWAYGAPGPTPPFPPGPFPPGSYPAGAYPPPAGYPIGAYPAPPPRGTNGFAIAALVTGIFGVLGAVFGLIALGQIRRTGQDGRGLAIAGVVLGGLWAAFFAVAIVAAIVNSASRDGDGTITDGGSVSATALRVGDCLVDLPDDTSIYSLDAVPCANPHEGEVFAVFDLPSGPYPGEITVQAQAEAECSTRLDTYAPSTVGDPSIGLYYVYPLATNWSGGDREVVCVATSLTGPTSGSIAGG